MQEATITIKNIDKSYEEGKQVLFDISLSINKGEIFGMLGPSGCGKTTLVKIIDGILPASGGKVEVLGEPMPQLAMLKRIGYMAQGDALYGVMTAKENLEFFGELYGLKGKHLQERIEACLKVVDLQDKGDMTVDKYSGGMKRRLSLAATLLHEPEILILDEPTVGIDPLLRQKIWVQLKKLSEQGITIVMTTHVMDEAEKCDRLAMMRNGRLLAVDTPAKLVEMTNSTNIEEAFIKYGGAEIND